MDEPAETRRAPRLTLWFSAAMLATSVAQLPYERFARFAFFDSGSDLTIHDLTTRGYRPTVDFGYIYGLLPVLVNRLWYGLAGASPVSSRLATLACDFLMMWGLARFVAASRAGPAGIALLTLALPDLLQVSYITLVHALEPALLIHALAEQARGKRGNALALVAACAFVKPSMAYLYGVLLVAAIGLEAVRARRLDGRRDLLPAVVTSLALAIVLAAVYGVLPVWRTLFSKSAALEVYRRANYGFFHGDGRHFWLRPGAGLLGYLRFEIGFWLAGTAVLIGGGLIALARRTRGSEVVVTCALLHAGFVCLFYASRYSWVYYYYLLLMGLAALSARGRKASAVVWCLAALVLFSDKAELQLTRRYWATESASPETLGLWATRQERAEWIKVLELTRGERPVLLARVEGAALLHPRFAPPVGAYFVPGHPTPSEVKRKAEQVATARVLVRAELLGERNFETWAEIAAALDGCESIWKGEVCEVYRRVRPPGR